ncbi:CoA transferase [Ramlibacter sp. G-1-2-2]|uniref:CoA transferase n=1 Tax=Ramlibacter agri TaxID=2728837 RepID=A0A848GXG4_9BURK|nr:CaiB/BaiF CoA-transferase family protein [Ramlibacter agri]NML43356.1 CoA transferase [Ramlibacter agri]
MGRRVTGLPTLDGLRVLDLSRVLAGPLAAQVLADLGADVIKIERPGKGDDTREWAPPTMVPTEGPRLDESVYFWTCNRGKRSATADIASPAGRALVQRLAREADVVIENYKVGDLARHGLDYDSLRALNPRLVYCSITGFGQTGPYREKPGYDTIVQALGGLMSITGDGEPRKSGVAVADQLTALYAVVGILAAVTERNASGQGQHIDMSLLDVQVASLTNIGMNYLATGKVPQRMGNRLATVYPSDNFRCRDGEIMLIVGNDQQFRRFCEAMELPGVADDPRFARNPDRLRHVDSLAPLVRAAFARTTVAHAQAVLDAAGVPAAQINDMQGVFDDPQVVARELVREVSRPDGRSARLIRNPIRFSRSPLQDVRVAPRLGEHTDQVQQGWPQTTKEQA